MNLCDKGIERLSNAVILQSVNDYRNALVRYHNHPNDSVAKGVVKSLEEFFESEDFEFWCSLDGEALRDAVKKEIIQYNYDLLRLRKSRNGDETEYF